MARKREFDEDAVLDAAMRTFWRSGYAATSMADIYAATGLKPGSLYAAFSDKETLFRAAFERYAARFRATLPKDARGLAAIESWIRLQAELAATDAERCGCLIVNTVLEKNAHARETLALAEGRVEEIRAFFVHRLAEARAAGEIGAGVKGPAAADALLGAVFAIMTLGRAGAPRRLIDNVADAALSALRPA